MRHRALYLVPFLIIGVPLFARFYLDGSIIFGGEGNYFVDFKNHAITYGSAWFNIGYGWPNVIPNAVGINHLVLIALSKLTGSYRVGNFVLVYSLYMVPYIGFLLLSRHLGVPRVLAVVVSLLYVINPFSITYLQSLNQWSTFSLGVMPILFFIVLKYRNNLWAMFFLVGILTRLFSFTFYNMPTGVVILSTIALAGLIGMFSNIESNVKLEPQWRRCIFSILVAYLGFVCFNFEWIAVLLYSVSKGLSDLIYTDAAAINWAQAVSSSPGLLSKVIAQTQMSDGLSTIGKFVSHPVLMVASYGFIIFLFWKLMTLDQRKLGAALAILLLGAIFVTKGTAPPFGFIYFWMLKFVPYFSIFKTPTEKFGILVNFIIYLSVIYVLSRDVIGRSNLVKFRLSWFSGFIVVYGCVCLFPILFTDSLASSRDDGNYFQTRQFVFDQDDYLLMDYLKENYLGDRVIILPGLLNYQVMLPTEYGHYTGLDPVLNNSGVSYIYPELDSELYDYVSYRDWINRLIERDIQAIIYLENRIPWFGEQTGIKFEEFQLLLKQSGLSEKRMGAYSIWDLPGSDGRISSPSM